MEPLQTPKKTGDNMFLFLAILILLTTVAAGISWLEPSEAEISDWYPVSTPESRLYRQ